LNIILEYANPIRSDLPQTSRI